MCQHHSPTSRSPFLPSIARQKPAALTSSSLHFAGRHVQYGLEPSPGCLVAHSVVQLHANERSHARPASHPFVPDKKEGQGEAGCSRSEFRVAGYGDVFTLLL